MGVAVAVTAVAAVAGLAGCSSGGKDGESSGGTSVPSVSIKAGDKTCEISKTTLPAGRHTFSVQNTSSQVTEVYIYAAGDRIVGEVEDVGPATTRSLVVDLPNGSYQVACKPGMAGSGIRTALTVNGVS
ncbi:MAG: cupredoxin domain-containing protein [Actinomycetota bacterium]